MLKFWGKAPKLGLRQTAHAASGYFF